MKKWLKASFSLNLVCAALFLGACSDPFKPDYASGGNTPPDGMGFVSLVPSPQKTLVPDQLPGIFSYSLVFTAANKAPVHIGEGNPVPFSSLVEIPLEPATWTVELTAWQKVSGVFHESGSGTGLLPALIAGAHVWKSIDVSYFPLNSGGIGIFEYSVSCTKSDVSGTLVLSPYPAGGISYPVNLAGFPASGTLSVPAGQYTLALTLTDSATGKTAGEYTAVHIYPGLKTRGDFAFDNSRFTGIVSLAGKLSTSVSGTNLSNSVEVRAYSDSARQTSPLGIFSNYNYTNAQAEWILSVPAGTPQVYLRFIASDSDTAVTLPYIYDPPVPITNIPAEGLYGGALPVYTMTINSIGASIDTSRGSIVIAGSRKAAAIGERITFNANPQPDSFLASGTVKVNNGSVALTGASNPYSFTMPAEPVSISAKFLSSEYTLSGTLGTTLPSGFALAAMDYALVTAYKDAAHLLPYSGISPAVPAATAWTGMKITYSELAANGMKVYFGIKLKGADGFDYLGKGSADIAAENETSGIPLAATVYHITNYVDAGRGTFGLFPAAKKGAYEGEPVTLDVLSSVSGYYLDPGSVKVTKTADLNPLTNTVPVTPAGGTAFTFIMPSEDVTLSANFYSSVKISGNLGITKPLAVTLKSGANIMVAAYSSAGRNDADILSASYYSRTASGWTSDTVQWGLDVPANAGTVYIRAVMTGDDNYRYQKDDVVSGIGTVNINRNISWTVRGITHTITGNGSLHHRPAANPGEDVTITVTPEANWGLKPGSLIVSNTSISGAASPYTFVMQDQDTVITAVFIDRVTVSGTVSYDIPASMTSPASAFTNVKAAAYRDEGRTSLVEEVTLASPFTAYSMPNILINIPNLYFTITATGSDNYQYVYKPAGSIPVVLSNITAHNLSMEVYGITIGEFDHGVIAASKDEVSRPAATPGDTVTLTVTPETNWGLKPGSLTVTGSSVSGSGLVYTFIMPSLDVSVGAEFIDRVTVSGNLTVSPLPAGVTLSSVKVEAFSDSSRSSSLGVYNPGSVSGTYILNSIPINTAALYFTITAVGGDGYEYISKPAAPIATALDDVTQNLTMTIYGITLPAVTGGTVTMSKPAASSPYQPAANPGETITLTVTPDDANWVLKPDSLTVTGTSVLESSLVYTFTMPSQDVIVWAEFVSTNALLAGFTLTAGDTPTTFSVFTDNGGGTYSVSITDDYVDAVLTVSLQNANASIEVDEVPYTSNDMIVTLNDSNPRITIVVTAQDGSTTRTYYINKSQAEIGND
ncbi:InlB B-repeat-containing protein [Leadbettera azotonutricia]|nr:cadherin-like beta sandwich domain-containing protein [Leadbettera azotonutricia]